ncbi:MAG TPA: hypothetical protein VGS59_14000 [Candidatus Acidoferrales bacterium]|nr:hypothetical protein [Candidatus Acidoferrales bacterium]
MSLPFVRRRLLSVAPLLCGAVVLSSFATFGQGPSPESAPTQFPGGAYISYNSVFGRRAIVAGTLVDPASPTAQPTFTHEGIFRLAWSPKTNWEVMAVAPIVTQHLDTPAASLGGTGFGDLVLLVKYRFLRRDSKRGTTQISFTAGPKLPTGQTELSNGSGALLPVRLQPGSGSTDVFFEMDGTYTGLLNFKRLVADDSTSYWLRTQGSQHFRVGPAFETRFWLSYRPYQTKFVSKEWFIGPSLDYQRSARDQLSRVPQAASGGSVLAPGVTTYFSPLPGLHLWFAFEIPAAQDRAGAPTRFGPAFSIGITRQFMLGRLK